MRVALGLLADLPQVADDALPRFHLKNLTQKDNFVHAVALFWFQAPPIGRRNKSDALIGRLKVSVARMLCKYARARWSTRRPAACSPTAPSTPSSRSPTADSAWSQTLWRGNTAAQTGTRKSANTKNQLKPEFLIKNDDTLTVMADRGKRYANGPSSSLPAPSESMMHSSAASNSSQCSVYSNLVSALPKLKLDSFLQINQWYMQYKVNM